MSHSPIQPDDPRLTAYVLGELDEAEAALVEAHLADSPESRAIVDDLRLTTATLFEALQSEPVPSLSDAQRVAVEDAAKSSPSSTSRTDFPSGRPANVVPTHGLQTRAGVQIGDRSAVAGRRGIAAVVTAAACLALLIGVSVYDFTARETASTEFFSGEEMLLATNGAAHDSHVEFEELVELQQTLEVHEEDQLRLQTLPADETRLRALSRMEISGPEVREVEQRRFSRSVSGVPVTGKMPAKPSAPGNLGDVTDFYSTQPRNPTSRFYFEGETQQPSSGNGQQGQGAPTPSQMEGLQRGVTTFSRTQGRAELRQLQQQSQTSSPPTSLPTHQWGASNAPQNYNVPTNEFGEAARLSITNGSQPAGVESKENGPPLMYALPFRRDGAQRLSEGESNLPSGESRVDAYGAGVIVGVVDPQSLSADLDVPFREGSFELGVPAFNGVSPIVTNGLTPQQDILFGTLTKSRSEREQLPRLPALMLADDFESLPYYPVDSKQLTDLQKSDGDQLTASAWRDATLSWEQGQWFATNTAGEKIAVVVPGTESYAPIVENDFLSPAESPLSTFGLDVDTASYANVRRFLMSDGRFPPPDAVRVEELVNYFTYDDPEPVDDEPLALTLEAAAAPWDTDHRLVRIGLKAKSIDLAERPPTTLVFLIDTSGSMRDENKLPLVKQSLRLLAEEMTENDRIAIVTYSTDAGLLLDSTSGEHQDEIIAAIEGLQADGSTNGEAGLKVAYEVAEEHFIKTGQNRVILCTDGDFNVGTSDTDPLVGMISEKRASGVFLSICGYGSGNIKDEKLERIADKGNGLYHYIDNIKEARKVFLDELTGTLYTVAKDVKLQVEFNPAHVASYRLLGYENRALAAEDFHNDRVDSGDMGAGHSVTALYEVVPVGVEAVKPENETPGVDPLKYRAAERPERKAEDQEQRSNDGEPGSAASASPASRELLTVKLRYKQPDGDESVKREFPLVDKAAKDAPSQDLEWSAAVVSYGMLLRGSKYAGQSSLAGVLELAQGAKGKDESGRRREFIDLVLQTQSLVRKLRGEASPEPQELSSTEARKKAQVAGKYQDLLDKLAVPGDAERYGTFHDYGWSADPAYAGRDGLPAGYWVYVYPDWYIWGENVATDAR